MTQHLTKSEENYFYTHEKHIYIDRFVKIEIKDREERKQTPCETKQKTNLKKQKQIQNKTTKTNKQM